MRNRLFNLSNMLLSGVLSLFGFGSCDFVRNENVECVYGPPPDYYDEPLPDDTLQESQSDTLPASQSDTLQVSEAEAQQEPSADAAPEIGHWLPYSAIEALIYNENEKPQK